MRRLATALKIHANTAQRAVAQLKLDGLLEIHPGIGTTVAAPPVQARNERARLLRADIEPLLVEAIRLGVDLGEFQELIAVEWRRLQPADRWQEA